MSRTKGRHPTSTYMQQSRIPLDARPLPYRHPHHHSEHETNKNKHARARLMPAVQHQAATPINNDDADTDRQMVWSTIQIQNEASTQQQQEMEPLTQPQHLEVDVEDDDEAYSCCDRHPRHLCGEGAKNLCTLAIWALIFFAVVNRFLIHYALHLTRSTNKASDVARVEDGSRVR